MNKKFLLFSLLLVSCDSSPLNKIKSSYDKDIINLKRVDNLDSLVEITSANHFSNIAKYDEAMIIISSENCTHCNNYFATLRTLIKKENILIYYFDISKYTELYNSSEEQSSIYPKVSGTPTTLFYKHGEIKNYYVGEISSSEIDKVLFNYVSISNVYYLNDLHKGDVGSNYYIDFEEETNFPGIKTSSLDKLISKGEKTNILFSWRKCNDCKDYYKYVLYPFLDKNPSKKIYVYEVDGYYTYKNYVDENNSPIDEYLNYWYSFSSKYHLNDYKFIDKYNNQSGVVPTILSIDGDNYSINVFKNDYGIIINDNNTISYSHSFYSEVTSIQSSSEVKSGDTSSKEYIKALKELNKYVLEKEVVLATNYLSNNL